ncbi:hypothetical protein [Planococcus salinus]|uniref:Uncharacterized protein n=1 Tax=Planococcus salinus TaxID=1848460 RepID=A0A3M8P9S8_9BACL|nr:hypothetical protein [Planococcus salinus]RNF40403.1 hypothetical protein EEX84_02970 [Planococcus salinus]
MLTLGNKSITLKRTPLKGEMKRNTNLSIDEIEKEMRFNNIQPIQSTPADEQDMNDKSEELRNWYEDELRQFFS